MSHKRLGFPFPFSGLVHVTGPKGVGKTTFAITATKDPGRLAFLDLERSGAGFHAQLQFGAYHDVVGELGLLATGEDLYYRFVGLVESLEPGWDVIVLDNVEPLENALEAAILAQPQRFGLTPGQMQSMPALKWGPYKDRYRQVLLTLLSKAELVVVTSHLKPVWAGSKPVPGLFRPKGKETLVQLASLSIWLQHHAAWPPPNGLVMYSRMTRLALGPEGPEPRTVLPLKLTPATWARIRQYMAQPYDPDHPRPEEIPSEEDWHTLRGTLTPAQLEFMRLAIQDSRTAAGEPEASEEVETAPNGTGELDIATFVQRLAAKGISLPDALRRLHVSSVVDILDLRDALRRLGA